MTEEELALYEAEAANDPWNVDLPLPKAEPKPTTRRRADWYIEI